MEDEARAGEALMCSVIRVDGKAIGPDGSGKPGPVMQKLQAAFQRFVG
jgi:hypothetical protein